MSFFIWAVCILWALEGKAPISWVSAARHGIIDWQTTIPPQRQLWKFFERPLSLLLKPLITPYPLPVNAFPLVNWNTFLESDIKTQRQDMNTCVENLYLELKVNPETEFSGSGVEGLQESAALLMGSAITAYRPLTKLFLSKQRGPTLHLCTKQILSLLQLSGPKGMPRHWSRLPSGL